MKQFCMDGPVVAERHYSIPPLDRIDLAEVLELIVDMRYFVLHAPQRTGKTSTLLALADRLNMEGEFHCVYANFEDAKTAHGDVRQAMEIILRELGDRARLMLGDDFVVRSMDPMLEQSGSLRALNATLIRWAEASEKPLVLLLDDFDSLVGDSLISVLRQLRAGYHLRPGHFPQCVILCGVRNVRNYGFHSSAEGTDISGFTVNNLKAESLRLADFSEGEVQALLVQHTMETGQGFRAGATKRIWELTCGQPWLVNALAYEVCFRNKAGRDRSRPIGVEAIDRAKEFLIRRRVTHLDILAEKLREGRVRRVIEPVLAGSERHRYTSRDLEYARDLGLIARDRPVRIANPIYREVVPRQLTHAMQSGLDVDPGRCRNPDGTLNVARLLERFQKFFRQHSQHWSTSFGYDEAGPHLVLQAFLQRVVNSGGRIEREYHLGRRRTDLLIAWPRSDGGELNYVIECKVVRPKRGFDSVVAEGKRQTAEYMDLCGAESGHLVVFDLRPGRTWEQRIFRRDPEAGGSPITVWGM